MQTMKLGDKGEAVAALQTALTRNGYTLKADGQFGNLTRSALLSFQQANVPESATGEYNAATEAALNPLWLPEAIAKKYPLPPAQYKTSDSFCSSKKLGVCLHHTAGGSNPFRVVEVWRDDDRNRVATHFIIGGLGANNNTTNDGVILQCIPLQFGAFHIALSRVNMDKYNTPINAGYIGIEICNWGYLDKVNGKYYNYREGLMDSSEVVELDAEFMGKKYWHRYTDRQVESVRLLLTKLKEVYGFKYESLPNAGWFDMDKRAQTGLRVLTTHTNFEGNMKADCSPQPNFFKMINNI